MSSGLNATETIVPSPCRTTSDLSRVGTVRRYDYGYLWWGNDFPYKGRTVHAFYAAGNGGQTVMAIPKLDLVVALYAGNYGDGPASRRVQNEYVREVRKVGGHLANVELETISAVKDPWKEINKKK